MEQPPPSQIILQAEESSAPPFFQPISAASILNGMRRAYQSKPHAPLTTGIPSIDFQDGVLGGGTPQGCVIGISSDLSEGSGRILALRLLIRDLLRFENRRKRAMIIDSTGTFPLPVLLGVVKGCVGEINDGSTKTQRGDRMPWREKVIVEGLLERIGITRVFDLEGVWDVVGEIRTGSDQEEEEQEGKEKEPKRCGHEEREEWLSRRDGGAGEDRWTKRVEETLATQRVAEKEEKGQEEMYKGVNERANTPEQPSPSAKSAQHDDSKAFIPSSHDTQPAQRTEKAPALPVSKKETAPMSSSLSPPPPDKEPDTSSPLSSAPDSPPLQHSASSSSLRSELVVEPSPVKERTNTVMSQAYQGESLPPSTSSEDEEINEMTAVSPSPLPPSSPPVPPPALFTLAPTFALPTGGFETHISEAAQSQHKDSDSDSDTDSSSDTSSYLRGEHPSLSRNNASPSPASQWQDSKAAPPPSILLIDSLPPLLTQFFRTGTMDRTTAHKELAQLSRVLTQMSRSTVHPLTVILLNSTMVPYAAKNLDEHLMRSVFADSKAIPSFGAVYDGMHDISLLVSKVPRGQEDAEALYAGYSEHCTYTHVVECLRDDAPDWGRWMEEVKEIERKGRMGKSMNREGRWGSFDVFKVDGEIVIRDPDLERKLGEYKDMGFGTRP